MGELVGNIHHKFQRVFFSLQPDGPGDDKVVPVLGVFKFDVLAFLVIRLPRYAIVAAMCLSLDRKTRFVRDSAGTVVLVFADVMPVLLDQADVPESSDWYNAGYIMTWGSNVPKTRMPDAHFLTEARYKGTKVVSVSLDYAESTAVADTWIPLNVGSDSAFAMAMGHGILNEYYWGNPVSFWGITRASTQISPSWCA